MELNNISKEFAADLIGLINSCAGFKRKQVEIKSKKTGAIIKYGYIPLDKIYEKVKSNQNIAVLTPIGTNAEGHPAVQVILVHKSGESIVSDYYALRLPATGSKQDEGSAITYTKRYALGSFLGITDEDRDDSMGNTEPIIDWREEYMKVCKEIGIDSIAYAKEHGINKQTTQEEFRRFVENIRAEHIKQEEPTEVVTMDEL